MHGIVSEPHSWRSSQQFGSLICLGLSECKPLATSRIELRDVADKPAFGIGIGGDYPVSATINTEHQFPCRHTPFYGHVWGQVLATNHGLF